MVPPDSPQNPPRAPVIGAAARVEALRNLLENRWLGLGAAIAGVVLTSSSLFAGLAMDDYFQFGMVRAGRPAWDLFAFLRPGGEPWARGAQAKIMFFRPLPSVLHWVEYRFYAGAPWLMHLHSVLWYGALVLAAAAAYHSIGKPDWKAGLATILFAIDASHGQTVGWIANRGSIIATVIGLVVLVAHDRSRRGSLAAWSGAVSFALALTCGEPALPMLGYLVAHALFVDTGRKGARAIALSPYLALTAAFWGVTRFLLDYGVTKTAYYSTLPRDWAALAAMVERFARLVSMQIGWIDVQGIESYDPGAWTWVVAYATTAALVVIALCRRDRIAAFWTLGALLSLLPAALALPDPRLLLPSSIGFAALVAHLVGGLLAPLPGTRTWSAWWAAAAAVTAMWAFAGLVLAPLSLPRGCMAMKRAFFWNEEFERTLTARPDQDAVVVSAKDFNSGVFTDLIRKHEGALAPRTTTIITATPYAFELARVGPTELSLRSPLGLALNTPLHLDAFRVGDRSFLPIGTLEVVKLTGTGAVEEARLHLDDDPAAPRFAFFTTLRGGALVPLGPIPIGQSFVVPAWW